MDTLTGEEFTCPDCKLVKELLKDLPYNLVDGIAISTEEFKEVYIGEESERMPIASAQTVKDAKLTIRDIKVEDGQVSLDVELIVDKQKIHFPVYLMVRHMRRKTLQKNLILRYI